VVTIHDVLFKSRPRDYPIFDSLIYDFKTQNALKRADIIIATSEFTAAEIQKYYTEEVEKYFYNKKLKIKVLYQSISTKYLIKSWSPDLNSPYIVYHSSFVSRKNHANLIRAFSQVCHLFPHNLVLAGKGNLESELLELVNELNLKHRIKIFHFPSDSKLEKLLVESSGFIYPSFSEGFGIPIVEAATVGVPMAVSKIPVFQELMNDVETVNWFNPHDFNDIANSILALIHCKHTDYSNLISRIDEDNICKQYLDIYQSLL
jgi:glycosyltransferase involved in cell wall biosynthesis